MIRKTLTFSIVLGVAALSVAAPFCAWHRTRLKLSEAENSLREQAAIIARLSVDKSRLSEKPAPSLSTDQLKELLRLRDEVGRLRETVAETKNLRAALQNAGPPAAAEAPGDPNYWPVDQLANAGRATPESTLKTWLWAVKNSDLKTMISCMGPEWWARTVVRDQKEINITNITQDLERFKKQAMERTAEMFAQTSAFRLVDEKTDSPGEMTILLSSEGQGVAQKFQLKKPGADWTIQDPGQPEIYEPGRHL